jgi:hypothetical protein
VFPSAQSNHFLPLMSPRFLGLCRKNSAFRTSSTASLACCSTWNLSWIILHCGAHCSMLSRNGSHMSTQTASILRNNGVNLVFASRYHSGDGSVFSTGSHTAGRNNADTPINIALFGDKSASNATRLPQRR